MEEVQVMRAKSLISNMDDRGSVLVLAVLPVLEWW